MTATTQSARPHIAKQDTLLGNTAIRNLAVLVLALAAISVWVYTQNTRRGTDLVAGSDFIKGLDIGKVDKITLSFGAAKDQPAAGAKKPNIVLARDGAGFVLAGNKSYPADTGKVNDLLFAIADIQVKKLVNNDASASERQAMGLVPSAKDAPTVHVQVNDASGKALTGFSIGKDHGSGGSYLQKDASSQVYLSKRNVFLARSYKDFVDFALLQLPADKLERVEQMAPKLAVEKIADKWVLMDPTNGSPLPAKAEKPEEWASAFARVDFEDFYRAASDDLQGLEFNQQLVLTLSDKMIYELGLAKHKDRHYAKVSARVADMPSEVTINPDDDKEKLAGIENMITAKERADRVNRQRSPWVYAISKADYERLVKKKAFFQ